MNRLLNPWIFIIIICIVYILLSIIPHYFFETNAYDLGIFNQTIYNYSNFDLGPSTLRHVNSLLGDHFEIYLFVFSPLFHLFQSYTLLIIQIVAIFLSAIGIYKFIYEKTKLSFYSWGATFLFLIFFGTVIAISFDYHNDIIGMAFLPWLFYFWEKKNINIVLLLAFFMSLAKEPFFLIAAMVGFSIFIFEKQIHNKIKGFLFFCFSILFFLFVLKVVIPYFGIGEYAHWSYKELGNDPIESFLFILLHPIDTFLLFFSDPLKTQSLKYFIVSGLCFSVFFPRYALIFLPFLAEKYFSSNPAHWGLYFHYNILLAPLISISTVLFFYTFFEKHKKNSIHFLGKFFFSIFIIGNLIITFALSKIYIPEYINNYNFIQNETRHTAFSFLEKIIKTDSNLIIAVQGNYIPHLTNKNLYISDNNLLENWYPDIILLDEETKQIWPFISKDQLKEKRIEISKTGLYDEIFIKNDIYIFQKIK